MNKRSSIKMESCAKSVEKANQHKSGRKQTLKYKNNKVVDFIRIIRENLPEGNRYYRMTRGQSLQHIIQYVTYLETTIDQISREKKLFLDLDFKILTKDEDNRTTTNHKSNNQESINGIGNSSNDESTSATISSTSGYISEDSKNVVNNKYEP